MKKFIIACTAVIIAVTCWMFVSDRIGSTLSFNMNKEVKTFTTVSDKEILVDTGNGMEPFEIRGVDMGVGIPGHFATDYAIDKETYLRWFRMIKDMGANCVRVYTLLQDDFYDAVWEFNHDNPDPLILSMEYGSMIMFFTHTEMLTAKIFLMSFCGIPGFWGI